MQKNFFLCTILLLAATPIGATPGVSSAEFTTVAVDNDGFIWASGAVSYNSNTYQLLARFNPFGSVDKSFGNAGYVITPIGSSSAVLGMVLANNQPIIVGGAQVNSVQEFTIAAYNQSGTQLSSFNGNGLIARSIGTGAVLNAVKVDASGNYIGAGIALVNGAPLTIVARYTPVGIPDDSFGLTGIAMKRIYGNAGSYDLALTTSGKIITAGYTINAVGTRELALIRFNQNGSIDTTLGTVGTIVTPIGADSCAHAVVNLANDYIVCAGVSNNQSIVVRYTPSGSLDENFGLHGIVATSIGSCSQINDIALQSNGNLVTVGYSDNKFALMRYTTQGVLDTTFGTNGIAITQIAQYSSANSLAIQPDGKIVVAGHCNEGAVIARYTQNGQLDTFFGKQGIVIFPQANNGPDIVGLADFNMGHNASISYEKLDLASSIMNSDISLDALIDDSKLQTISSPGKIDNRATSATSFAIPNGIVMRDTLGNFSANTILGTLVGDVQGAASHNLLKNGDTMLGTLIVQPGSAEIPSLQFSDNDQTGFSAQQNTLSITTHGAQRLLIDGNGSVTINAPYSGAALNIQGGGATIEGDILNSGNLLFNSQQTPLNAVGSTQGAAVKLFTGTDNTGLSGSVTIDYTDANFANVPVICANAINGSSAVLTINNIGSSAATITSVAALNVPFNYILVGI